MVEWKYTDPRLDVDGRVYIVILRPLFGAGTAIVNTEEVYNIFTDYEDHLIIKADEEWDQDWCWILGPEKGKL
jgi:hypothetical protein